jgi:hypothetical protein
VQRYLFAAVGVKSTTGKSGVFISPYTSMFPGPERRVHWAAMPREAQGAAQRLRADQLDLSTPVPVPTETCEQVFPAVHHGHQRPPKLRLGARRGLLLHADTLVSISAVVDALTCDRSRGISQGDTMLRVCDGLGGCTDTETMPSYRPRHDQLKMLGQSDDACGTKYPSVVFTCPHSGYRLPPPPGVDAIGAELGVVSVMRANKQSGTENADFDAVARG